jgi:hypothetical protein
MFRQFVMFCPQEAHGERTAFEMTSRFANSAAIRAPGVRQGRHREMKISVEWRPL